MDSAYCIEWERGHHSRVRWSAAQPQLENVQSVARSLAVSRSIGFGRDRPHHTARPHDWFSSTITAVMTLYRMHRTLLPHLHSSAPELEGPFTTAASVSQWRIFVHSSCMDRNWLSRQFGLYLLGVLIVFTYLTNKRSPLLALKRWSCELIMQSKTNTEIRVNFVIIKIHALIFCKLNSQVRKLYIFDRLAKQNREMPSYRLNYNNLTIIYCHQFFD